MKRTAARAWASALTGVLVAVSLAPGALALTPRQSAATADVAAVADPGYSDVDGTNAFFDDIAWLASEGITTGYPDGSFHPSEGLSRQAFAAFLFRLDGQKGGGPCAGAAPFPDVAQGGAFCEEIAWLATQGVTTGYADGGFHPAALISRQAMAAFLYRYDHVDSDTTACLTAEGPFPDVATDLPFCEAIRWMASVGPEAITTGYGDGTFRPATSISRQAMAAFLHRYRLHTPAAYDVFEYDLRAGTVEVAAAEIETLTQRTVADAVFDDQGAMVTAPVFEWDVTFPSGVSAPNDGDGFFLAPGAEIFPQGLAGRVIAKSVDGAGVTTLVVAQEELDFLFDYLHMEGAGRIDTDGFRQSMADLEAGTTPASGLGNLGVLGSAELLPQALPVSPGWWSCNDTIGLGKEKIKATFDFDIRNVTYTKDIELGLFASNKRIGFTVSAEIVTNVDVSLKTPGFKVGMDCKSNASWENGVKWNIPVGPGILVSIGPYIKFGVAIEGSINLENITYITEGFHASQDDGLKIIDSRTSETHFNSAQLGITAWAEGGMKLDVSIMGRAGIYGSLGAKFTVDMYLKLVSGGALEFCGEAHAGVTAALGAFVDLWITRWEWPFVGGEYVTWQDGPYCSPIATGDEDKPKEGSGAGVRSGPYYTPDASWSPPAVSTPSSGGVAERDVESEAIARAAIGVVRDARAAAQDALSHTGVATTVASFDPGALDAANALVDRGHALVARAATADTEVHGAYADVLAAKTMLGSGLAAARARAVEVDAGAIVVDAQGLTDAVDAFVRDHLPAGPRGNPTPMSVASGEVWGLGNLEMNGWGDPSLEPYMLPALVPAVPLASDVALSGNYAGSNPAWLLGRDGTVWDLARMVPEPVGGLPSIAKIFACGPRAYALTAGGDLYAWGRNDGLYQFLGIGGSTDAESGVLISGVADVAQLVCDRYSTAVRTTSGDVWVWGRNYLGERDGNPAGGAIVVPRRIAGIDDAIDVALGYDGMCAVRSDHTVWCWGETLGTVDTDPYDPDTSLELWRWSSSPTQVVRVTDADDLEMGLHTWYAKTASGDLWAWGENYDGALGDGTGVDRMVPIKIEGISDVAVIKAQHETKGHDVYVIKTDGTVWDWGNGWGDWEVGAVLGQGTGESVYEPTQVPRLHDVVKLVVTTTDVYALDSHGTLWFWCSGYDLTAIGYDFFPTLKVSQPVAITHIDNVGDFAAANASLFVWAH